MNTKPKYDLAKMAYCPKTKELRHKFCWDETPQGFLFWRAQEGGLTDEGRAALSEMQAQWEQEQGATAQPKKLSDSEMLARAIEALRQIIAHPNNVDVRHAAKAFIAEYDNRGEA